MEKRSEKEGPKCHGNLWREGFREGLGLRGEDKGGGIKDYFEHGLLSNTPFGLRPGELKIKMEKRCEKEGQKCHGDLWVMGFREGLGLRGED